MRVSALQWALLIRVDGRCTPRGLALELGRGVFATTVEVSRLLRLRLLAVAGAPGTAPNRGPAGTPGLRLAAVSYIQAVTG